MSDLIRKQEVIDIMYEVFEKHSIATDKQDVLGGFGTEIFKRIKELPIAFNKEAVIKQMQEYAECKEECKNNFYYGQGCKACAWNRMIEIVKAGAK